MKICLSVFDFKNSTSPSKVLAKEFKDSGVKKVLVIGIVSNVQENYINLKALWINIGIHLLNKDFTIATDLKLCNILLGLMSHSSLHPCCWCDVDKHNLDKKGNQRTLGSLSKIFWSYYDAGGSKKMQIRSVTQSTQRWSLETMKHL